MIKKVELYSVVVKCYFKKGLISSDLHFRKIILAIYCRDNCEIGWEREELRKTPRFLVWVTGKMIIAFTDTGIIVKSGTDNRVEDDSIFMKKWSKVFSYLRLWCRF